MVLLALACADQVQLDPAAPTPTAPVVQVQQASPREAPLHSQDELAEAEGSIRLSGELICVTPGPFELRVYPRSPDGRLYSSFPSIGFLAAIDLAEAGPFTMLAPAGESRLLLAWHDSDGNLRPSMEEVPFFADPHAQPFSLTEDREGLVLDCAVAPSEPGEERLARPDEPVRLKTTMKELRKEAGLPDREPGFEELLGDGPE